MQSRAKISQTGSGCCGSYSTDLYTSVVGLQTDGLVGASSASSSRLHRTRSSQNCTEKARAGRVASAAALHNSTTEDQQRATPRPSRKTRKIVRTLRFRF